MPDPSTLGESESNRSRHHAAWRSEALGPAARALVDRDAAAFLHQSASSPCLNAVSRAEGAYLWDLDGRRYLDFHGNNVHHIGYGHPRLKAAIAEQMERLPFAPRRFASAEATALAERLGALAPGALSKVLFAPSGSDAVEIALRLARIATGRFKTVSFWDSYHGAGFGASSVGGEAMFRSHGAGPLLPGAEHVAPFACYRCPYGHPAPDGVPELDRCRMACAGMIAYALEREGDVAAVIAEPARAAPHIPPPGFWAAVRAACDAHGALLIFDEIPTGLGKTGRLFACEHDGVVPDILVLGKALGGGMLPLAAVLARPELDVAGDVSIGHYTHEKNPVLARAGLTTLDVIEDEGLVANAAAVGAQALAGLKALQRRIPRIGDVRGRGCLIGIDLVRDPHTRAPDAALAEAVLYRCLAAGLSFKISLGSILTWTPPLIVTPEQMAFALETLETALGDALAAEGPG